MGRKRIPSAEGGAYHEADAAIGTADAAGKGPRRRGAGRPANKSTTRRAANIAFIERRGKWHLHGRLHIGRGVTRVSESTGLSAAAANPQATEEAQKIRRSATNSAAEISHPFRSRSRPTNT
jgi:hypothetical protein